VYGFRKRQLAVLLACVSAIAGLLALAGSAGADPVDSKRAEAERAMEQINQMDVELEGVIDRYNGAVVQLQQTTAKLKSTRVALRLARKSLGGARHSLARRVISVYMEQGSTSDSTVAILFQATSIEDMINRIEAAQRISDHDSQVVRQVKTFSDKVAVRESSLEKMQTKQEALVAQKAAEKSSVERKIAERKAYYRRVKREIASLIAEQRRQSELAAERARRVVANYPSTPAVETPIGPVDSSSVGTAVVQAAMTKLGAPYSWGAAGPDAFDCSGLVVWAFGQVGMGLPHYSYAQMSGGVAVGYSDLEPGDLVFFYGGSHVGIYVGGGQFIHAPHTGSVVQVNSLSGYGGGLSAARRYG
jgi:cell wall-associated NlpC family hydrolase